VSDLRDRTVLVLAIHNREVSTSSLIAKLHGLGFPRIITWLSCMTLALRSWAHAIGWPSRSFIGNLPNDADVYELWADETSRKTYVDTLRFRLAGVTLCFLSPSRKTSTFRQTCRPGANPSG